MCSFYSCHPIPGIAGVTEGVELSADLENQFALKKYEAEVAQEDGTDKLMEIDEVNAMKLLMGSPVGFRPSGGIRINQVKYQFLRGMEDHVSKCNTILGKKGKTGCVLSCTNTVIVIATYDEMAGHNGAACATTVSDLCNNLCKSGY